MSGALQMRAPEKRAYENCASSGIPHIMRITISKTFRPLAGVWLSAIACQHRVYDSMCGER